MGRLNINQKTAEALISFKNVSKSFGATKALINCNIDFKMGEIHSLVGENGAGKSTLGKIILGAYKLDSGQMLIEGKESQINSPVQSVNLGLVGISQELSLLPSRTVVDNIAMGRELTSGFFVSSKKTKEKVLSVMNRFNLFLNPDSIVGSLSVAEQQKVEILRALNSNARLIVFDEPTARLASNETEQLHFLVNSLAKTGTTIIYISHFLEEVLSISDRISLLRNGQLIRTNIAKKETKKSLIEGMTGKEEGNLFPKIKPVSKNSETILQVSNLTRKNEFEKISFEIKRGEIVGLSGLVGSGRSELALTIFGDKKPDKGKINFYGKEIKNNSINKSIDMGIAMVPESRRTQGLILARSLIENISLPYLKKFSSIYGVNKKKEKVDVIEACNKTTVKHNGVDFEVQYLSGGNQQKILFAKAAMGKPRLLIADEPTRGVDIGAKKSIYELIAKLSDVGESVLLISSEIEEIIGMSNRVLVMSRGKLSAELEGSAINKKTIMEATFKN
ncbi:MAG: Xylose import ATP-binding protein XylG [Alphaproteobacteria bacterium MarineAlpha5_Bin5]|nr:MAG: Xylose import ATP-binding protein XylG [Alphaproteobacteria bacterium MarineAlpha5_Bin5]PPR52800.1 MAG: Xylose import ATP-binding protein XylG [Alphaproteobacteria bacterium MarineAlpha5_Bin4]